MPDKTMWAGIAIRYPASVRFVVLAPFLLISFSTPVLSWQGRNAPASRHAPIHSVKPRVDQLFAQWNRPDSPGCSLGISKNGVPIYEYGYGMASLELHVPMTSASVLPAASISKQFTAMSILLLAKRGRGTAVKALRRLNGVWKKRRFSQESQDSSCLRWDA